MTGAIFRRLLGVAVVGLMLVALSGCGDDVEGTYHDVNGGITVILKGGKATVRMMGESKELTYTVKGEKITIVNPKEGNIDLTRNPDGTLSMGVFGTLKKS